MKKNHSLAQPRLHLFSFSASAVGKRLIPLLLLVLPFLSLQAAQLKQARVSQVIRDVKLLPQQAAPRPASVSDEVGEGTAVRTGLESRAELTFTDRTLTRLGANTIFSFDQGTRNLQLGGGAMLLRVPKDAGGARINTAAITAAITGTTMLLEYHPNAFCKFIMLEGVARIFRNNKVGESVLLRPGQMLIVDPNGKGLPDPVDVDLDRLMKTSLLITGFGPLPSLDLIAQAISEQDAQKEEGSVIDTNLVIYNGTIVSLLDPTNTSTISTVRDSETPTPTETMTPPPTPTPTPEKFGTPTVIASSTPYAIGSGTVIQTDPSITTNGQTDFGKIYRGPTLDGSISTFLFTATSAFDNFLQFDARFQVVDLLPLAVFKFSSLQLTGNPTILLTNGGATNLALISVGDITSGPPGGTLTFAGLDSLIIATQNGSITLTSDLAFEDIPSLGFYARGAGSNLTLDSAISGTTNLFLGAEGSIIANNSLSLVQTNTGVDLGLFTVVFAGENFTLGNSLTIVNDNSGGVDLTNGGSIIINVGGDFSVAGAGTLTLNVLNNGGSDLGSGGDIFVTTGGDLTAGTIDAFINNRDGGSIDDGGNLSFEIGGDLTTSGDATFIVSGRSDGLGGGTFASGVSVTLGAASISTGGFIELAISANAGGFMPSAFLSVDVPGSVFASGGYFSEIQSTGFNVPGGPFIEGGMITGDALLLLNFGSLSSGDVFDIEIDNFGQGTIGGDALLSVAVAGDLNAASDIFADIINTAANHNGVLSPGGMIGGDATVIVSAGGDIIAGGVGEFAVLNNDLNFLSQAGTITGDASVFVDAVNITTGGFFQPLVNNTNGSIGGNASVEVDVTDDISVGAETFFNLLNSNGTIGGEALSDLFASNFSSGSTFEFQILNDSGSIGGDAILSAVLSGSLTSVGDSFIQITNFGGTIFGDATITFTAGGDINSQGIATFNISNNDFSSSSGFGTIVGNALVSVSAASITTADSLFASIVNLGSSIDGNAAIDLLATGGITSGGDSSINIFNADNGDGSPAGTIGGDATVNVDTGDISIAGSSVNAIYNTFVASSNVGTIGGDAILTFNAGAIAISDAASFKIDSNDGGEIGGNATINLSAASLSVDGALGLLVHIINFNGGTIGQNALIDFSIANNVSIQNAATFQILNEDNDNGRGGGTIGGSATIDISTADVTASSFLSQIVNGGGTVVGDSTINMNVSGSATVTSDATVQILGSDGTASAAININGGNYDAGGTFLTLIDGDGAITFNNVTAHADVLKVGALGTNGVLTIGGGSLSGDTMLKLYAGGSNGAIDFVSNVTLSSETNVLIAANTVTINNGVVVTIAGDDGADAFVFTNVPNYTGSGGNDSTTGMFAGNGATTAPFSQAPPFDAPDAPEAPTTGSSNSSRAPIPTTGSGSPGDRDGGADVVVRRPPRHVPIVRVADSNELLELADRVTSGPAETAAGGSNGASGRSPRAAGSISLGKGRSLPSTRNFEPGMNLVRGQARRPAALP
jgi:FecR protein